jgi:hypothetical protein
MNEVIERLEGLAMSGHAGDWVDVLARAERRRAADFRRRALIAVVAVVLLAAPALALADRLDDLLVVSGERSEPAMPWIAGNRVHGLGAVDVRRLAVPLARDVSYPSLFNTSAAIASPDHGLLLYRASDPPGVFPERATPILRLHDLTSGRDRVVVRGAASFAWQPDGALAYAMAESSTWPHPDGSLGHVFVRPSLDDPAVRWTSERARYTVLAWAGKTLLVGAMAAGAAVPFQSEGVYAFNGRQRARKLPIASVVAIDPSGELVVGPVRREPWLAGALTFRIVRVSDGTVVAQLALPSMVAPRITYGAAQSTGGSWAGSYIVIAVASAGTELRDALVVLRFDGHLEPSHVFWLEPDSAADAGFGSEPHAFHSPRFLSEDAKQIVAWAGITERDGRDVYLASAFLHCERMEKRCRRTNPLPGTRYRITGPRSPSGPPAVLTFVENMSRPLPEP